MDTSEVKVEKIDLDAEQAALLLSVNSGNRPMKRRSVERYVSDMIGGRWMFTGDAIKVDEEGLLLDGQNRCQAVIEAQALVPEETFSIPVLIARGIPRSAQDVMDVGKGRSVSDQLARRGTAKYAKTGAAVRLVKDYLSWPAKNHSNVEYLQFFDDHRADIEGSVEAASDYRNTSGVNASVMAAAHYLISEATGDSDEAGVFIAYVATGAEQEEGSPVLALRSRSIQAKMNREVIPNTLSLYLVLRTWNAYRTGTKKVKLPIRPRGKVSRPEIQV